MQTYINQHATSKCAWPLLVVCGPFGPFCCNMGWEDGKAEKKMGQKDAFGRETAKVIWKWADDVRTFVSLR